MKANSKRGLPILLALVIGIFGFTAFGLAACDEVDEPPVDGDIVLTAPVVELINGNVLSWEPVANATRYIVYEGDEENGTNVNATTYTINKSVEGEWVYTVAAYNAQANPKVGPKSNPVTYKRTQEDIQPGGPGTGGDDDDDPDGPGTGGDDDDRPSLSAPIVDIEGNALNWSPVLNAASYDVYKNGDKIDSVESFSVVGMNVLPTTYTVTGAVHGDKFEVVAVSDDENVKDSEPSEEVEYAAVATTLSKTASVYVVSSSTAVEVPVSDQETGSLYKVVIKQNNNLALSTGIVGTDSIYVQGSASGDSSPYAADAVYDIDNGVWVARVMLTAENKLYLTITAQLEEVLVGYTVSLEDPYETSGDEEGVVNTYQLGATGSVDVVIPYSVGGFSIKIELEDDVPETGIVIYVVLEDESTSSTIYLTVGNANPTPIPSKSGEGYYVSTAFDLASTVNNAIYLSASSVDLNATVSIEIPDIFYRNIPKLSLSTSVYDEVINQGESAANMYDLNDVAPGEYIVTVSSVNGISFYGRMGDEGSYTRLSSSSGIYTLEIEKTANARFLYLYQTSDRDGATVSISLFEKGEAASYEIFDGEYLEAVLIGDNLDNATEFKLIDVDPGKYTLKIMTNAYGLVFKVVVGETTYTLKETEYDNIVGYSTSEIIEIDGEEAIYIYLDGNSVTVNLSFNSFVEAEKPGLTHGNQGTKFDLVALYGSDASVTFALNDVPDGTYTVALRGFADTYASWVNLSVVVGGRTVQLCNPDGSETPGYLGDQTITISGEKELTVQILNGNVSLKLTIYLLAEGESLDEGNGGSETSANIKVNLGWMYGDQTVDVSELEYGIYTITLEDVDDSLGTNVYLTTEVDGEITLNSGNGYTASITINSGAIKLNGVGQTGEIWVKLVKTGDLPLAGGGEDTELTLEFDDDSNAIQANTISLDVSSLQYGTYTVTLENVYQDFFTGYASYYITDSEDEKSFTENNGWTVTVVIDSDTLSFFTTAIWEPLTIKFVKVA